MSFPEVRMASASFTPSPELAKAMAEMNLQGLEYELPATRNVILAITDPDFRIDPKARPAIELAWHVVSVDVQMLEDIASLKFEMEERYKEVPKTPQAIVQWYEEKLPEAVAKVRAMSGEQLLTPIDFYGMYNFPAFMYIPFASKHHIHHRGFLSACLRPMGSKVPSIYGGSADEPFQL
jgi:uncharacterized damage-inducible protein DinB